MNPSLPAFSRRSFLKSSTGAGVLAGGLAFPAVLSAKDDDSRRLKVGLVGCGGRGSGAAANALTADSNAELWAVGDVFEGALNYSVDQLQQSFRDRVNVESRRFVGLDAYTKVLDSGVDVVILATPPGFRPQHFEAAVAAGKHIFCEKPVAVDATGVRQVLAAAAKAKEKGLSIVSGFCWRRSASRVAAFERVLGGDIGDVVSYYATYYTGPVKPMPPASSRKPEWSDVEWQIRNWYNFSWLSGDSLVEQAVHSVDKIGWAFRDRGPVACVATGGRQTPAEGGNIFDHFAVIYEYPNRVFCTMASRQQSNCDNENADYITGTKGSCVIRTRPRITGEKEWRFDGEDNDMYLAEHVELFRAIRSGTPVNDGEWMVNSTLMAIMGRMAAYTGKRITWDQIVNSKEDLAPDDLQWDSSFSPTPMPVPGVTQVV